MMKRLLLTLTTLTLLLCVTPLFARGKLQGYIEKGGASVTSGGFLSTTKVQQSYPAGTVTAYLAGTLTPATLYSDAAGTAKANPFPADSTGLWFLYAEDGCYDLVFKSGSTTLYTLSDMCIRGGVPEFSITSFGAKADAGVTNNRVAIQAAIDAACIAHGKVKVPGATSYYGIAGGSINITCTGLTLEGDGVWSQLYRGEAGDLLQIGDNVTQISDVTVRGISFNGVDAAGWSINARKAPNTLIEWNNFSNSSTASGALSMSECWNSRIMNNTVGALKGTGFKLTNSTNSVPIIGNRIDGAGGGSTTAVGMYLAATTLDLSANTLEGLNVGLDIVAATGVSIIGNYFEHNSLGAGAVDIRATTSGIATGITISSNYFAPNGTARSIDLDLVRGVYIGPNIFAPTLPYTSGYPIRFGGSAQKVQIDLNAQKFDDVNEYGPVFGTKVSGTSQFNGLPVSDSYQHTGDLTVAKNLAKVKNPGGTMLIRVRYYLTADNTDLTGTRSETRGVKSAIYQLSTSGAWTLVTAFANELAEITKNTASVLTIATANGDFSGAMVTVAATNYNGANALAQYELEVTQLGDGVATLSRP